MSFRCRTTEDLHTAPIADINWIQLHPIHLFLICAGNGESNGQRCEGDPTSRKPEPWKGKTVRDYGEAAPLPGLAGS